MKYIAIPILIAFFASTPMLVFGNEVDICDEGTVECLCQGLTPGIFGANEFDGVAGSVESVDACQERCLTINFASEEQISTYSVRCEVDGDLLTVSAGDISILEETREAFYADPELGVDIPGLEFTPAYQSGNVVSTNYLGEYIQGVYNWAIAAGAVLAVLMVMVGGLQYALARGNAAGIQVARQRISNAVSGLILLLGAYLVAFYIDPSTTQFDALRLQSIEKIEFVANETPFDFVEQDFEIVEEVGNNGAGWNGVPMWDQKAYPTSPYGPISCMTETSGNVKSSGCGPTSFAMILSAFGTNIDPATVALDFWEETINDEAGFRPICDGCGCSGTHYRAFTDSRLLGQYGLQGRIVGTDRQQEIVDLLTQGKLIIYLYRTESGGGHYVVMTGLDDDGMVLVNNPWGGKKERRTLAQVFSAAKGFVYVDTIAEFIADD